MRLQVGSPSDQWFNSDGTPTLFGYERLKNIFDNLPTEKVAPTAPADGEGLTFVAANNRYEPG